MGYAPSRHVGSPLALPWCVPAASVAERIFLDFRENFRKLEHWHLCQRQKVVAAKHAEGMAQLYRELRQPRAEQVDFLTYYREYAILATEPSTGQVFLDPEPDFRGTSVWTLDGAAVILEPVNESTCQFCADVFPEEGAVLEQAQTLVSPSDIQDEFIKLWKPRWTRHVDVSVDAWSRIVSFVEAFLPSFSFTLPELDVATWHRALKRFKPHAARGPDGWARDDLAHLLKARTEELLQVLASIEAGEASWPDQLLEGLVCALDKGSGRSDANGYRPIVLFSVIYRCWSGIRARQALRLLRDHLPQDLLGFVPGREAEELWYSVQVQIELSCQGASDLLGMSTDIIKAFNHLPRLPVFCIARRVGLPSTLLAPWQNFLAGVSRRFLVRQEVSDGIRSVTGFPEEDPLSPLAMLLIDWAYHVYAGTFAPAVRCLSFVDNLTCTAPDLASVARGLSVTQCFHESLDLELDPAKTILWTTSAHMKPALKAMGHVVVDATRELGGIMSFQGRVRNQALRDRCDDLEPLWQALQRSRAPLHLKLQALPAKFWSRALHSVAICPLGDSVLHRLRTAATTALSIRPGGVSSMLRLCVTPCLECDPGFWQLWTCVRDLRRMAGKLPNFAMTGSCS